MVCRKTRREQHTIVFAFSSPNCRCEISKSNCTRNLAVEKTISELPIQCDYCLQTYLRAEIKTHQTQNCSDRFVVNFVCLFFSRVESFFRPVTCDYSLLGCNWAGPFHSLSSHLDACEYPSKTGLELIDTIRAQKHTYDDEKKCLETVVYLLSLNQIGVSGMCYSKWNFLKTEILVLFRFNFKTISNG
mgnify:FL=1